MQGLFLERVRVDLGGAWKRLPEWAASHLELGAQVGRASVSEGRLVVAIAVPIRAFAAVLGATGVVLGRASSDGALDSPEENFRRLTALGRGTAVMLERDAKHYPGILSRIDTIGGEQYLRIQVQDQEAGGEAHYIPARESLRVTPAHGIPSALPTQMRGKASIARRTFVRSVIRGDQIRRFATETRLDCVLIGRRSILAEEIVGTELIAECREGAPASGKFNDVLRVRQLLFPGKSYKTELISATAKGPSVHDGLTAHTVVFDGATAYIKWRHLWRESHALVLLDKTEQRYGEAVSILNQELTRPGNVPYKSLPGFGSATAVDVFAYQSRPR